eukprot:IDg5713t1
MAEQRMHELRSDSPTALRDIVAPTPLSSHNFFERYPQCEEGSLHGESCTVQEYHRIPLDYGRYDLLDGVLEARPMPSPQHSALQHELLRLFNARQRRNARLELYCIRMEAKLQLGTRTFRIPDIVVGKVSALDDNNQFILSCMRGTSGTPVRRPELIIEITSSNGDIDRTTKKIQYQKARVPLYWIVDHDSNVVRCFTLGLDGEYKQKVHRFRTSFNSLFFGRLSVRAMLEPPSPRAQNIREGERSRTERNQLQQEAAASERRRRIETARADETERALREAEQERRKAEQERRKEKERSAWLLEYIRSRGITPPGSPQIESTDKFQPRNPERTSTPPRSPQLGSPSSPPPRSPSRSPPRRRARNK